jgi:succinate dehydrogenase / fumarate reductase flavoprotein subunit
MYHQFKELAEVDITAEPMEVGPTCHYVMGGVEVDPETAARSCPAVRRGRGGRRDARQQPARRQLAVGPAGLRPARRRRSRARSKKMNAAKLDEDGITAAARPRSRRSSATAGENPYTIHQELQQAMNDLVGIIRTAAEIEQALTRIEELKVRAKALTVEGHRQYNPGWHLALDLPHMLRVSECVAKAALLREESRGGHTRDDFPGPRDDWAKLNLICTADGEDIAVSRKPLPEMPDDLAQIFEEQTPHDLLSDAQGLARRRHRR